MYFSLLFCIFCFPISTGNISSPFPAKCVFNCQKAKKDEFPFVKTSSEWNINANIKSDNFLQFIIKIQLRFKVFPTSRKKTVVCEFDYAFPSGTSRLRHQLIGRGVISWRTRMTGVGCEPEISLRSSAWSNQKQFRLDFCCCFYGQFLTETCKESLRFSLNGGCLQTKHWLFFYFKPLQGNSVLSIFVSK